ncbi:hypothetical protein SAMN05444157_1524 [Frankineae bacterium MT45]|nr:hypothetical protein SAMN05444157_1524 [Frankineae bacterium MT45]
MSASSSVHSSNCKPSQSRGGTRSSANVAVIEAMTVTCDGTTAPVPSAGSVGVADTPTTIAQHGCEVAGTCVTNDPAHPQKAVVTYTRLTSPPNAPWGYAGMRCVPVTAAAPATPQVTAAMVRAAVTKLLPTAPLGVTPAGGQTLVNMQTIFWLDTPAQRTLADVTLLGHQVRITIRLHDVAWDFGDGNQVTATSAGRPYTSADRCSTPDCPGFFGHTYTQTTPVGHTDSITATPTWSASYTVDNGPANAIPGTIVAKPTRTTITIAQQRGRLVPEPTP